MSLIASERPWVIAAVSKADLVSAVAVCSALSAFSKVSVPPTATGRPAAPPARRRR
jgi:hypothetical protein